MRTFQEYRPEFPDRFDAIGHARSVSRHFFTWYNDAHHHRGLSYLTPADVHYGRATAILEVRSPGARRCGQVTQSCSSVFVFSNLRLCPARGLTCKSAGGPGVDRPEYAGCESSQRSTDSATRDGIHQSP